MTLPPPLTPPDADLRDFRFMPLDVVRFAQSDLVAFEEPAAVVAAVLLWGASWHALPAGSLTDDDRALSRLAGYGRGGSEWKKVREGALHGWVRCSDGRLYHAVVAEKVLEAWTGKLKQRHRTFCAAIRKHNERNPEDKRDAPTFEAWEDAGRPESVTRDSAHKSRVTEGSLSRAGHAKNPSKGQGQGQGQGNNKEEGGAAAPTSSYAFSGKTIRLTADDLAEWRKAYHAIPDLDAELLALDGWFQSPAGEKKRGSWFHTASGALNRKHQELTASSKAPVGTHIPGGCTPIRSPC